MLAWLDQGPVTDLPGVLGLLLAPEGLAHQVDQDLPEKRKGRWAQQIPWSLHTTLGCGDEEG